ncbi:MAG: hypothetical protein P8X70_00810 [Nanoarchaeota archaeon]
MKFVIYDVYFSDMLRNSKEIFKMLKDLEEFQYMNDDTIRIKLLTGWVKEDYEFDPTTNTGDIFSYYGEMKFKSRGEEKILTIYSESKLRLKEAVNFYKSSKPIIIH